MILYYSKSLGATLIFTIQKLLNKSQNVICHLAAQFV